MPMACVPINRKSNRQLNSLALASAKRFENLQQVTAILPPLRVISG